MQEHNNTSAILKQHVDTAVALINNLKKRNIQLETEHQLILAENKRIKEDMERYTTKINGYKDKLKALEKLLDDAQNEQTLLEQSVLAAISNLGTLENDNATEEAKTTISPDTGYHEEPNQLFEDSKKTTEKSSKNTDDSIESVIEEQLSNEENVEEKDEPVQIF